MNTDLLDDEFNAGNKISSSKKVTRCHKKIFVHRDIVEAVMFVVNEDKKDINMCSNGNDELSVLQIL